MKHLSSNQTSLYKNGKACLTTQYDFNNKSFGFAISKINGRYPESGYFVNKDVQEMIFVLGGKGMLCGKNGECISFKKGDSVLIDKGESCFWLGKCKVITICCPAWYESQHEIIN